MARLITHPVVIEFLELLNGVGDTQILLEEYQIGNLRKEYHHKTLVELDIRKTTHAMVLAVKDDIKGFIFNPSPETRLTDEDVIIVMGTEFELKAFRKHYL